jgi:hypothetical protein
MLRQMHFSIPRSLGYMSEQAIYMVNSFQFTSPTFALHGISPIFGGRIPFTVNVGFVEKPWVKT